MDTTEAIVQRFQTARRRKDNWKTLYEDAQTYISPHRESFDDNTEVNPGEKKDGGEFVYDSTGIDACDKFVSNLQSSLVPPMQRWTSLVPGSTLQGNEDLEKTLGEITDIMFDNLRNSNFDTQVAESFYDLAIGTGAFLAMKGTRDQPFHFVNVPLSQLYLEEGPNGRIDTQFRYWGIKARNIQQTWPDAVLDGDVMEIIREKPDETMKVIEATYPAEVEIVTQRGKAKMQGYKYCVILEKGKKEIVRREQRSSPWIVFRWSTLPGEIYGRGVGLKALPDMKTLSKTKEYLLKAASINLGGIWTGVDDGTVNLKNIKLAPGTIVPVASNGGSRGKTLDALLLDVDVNLSQLIISDLQNSIRNIMFADPLGPIDLPVKSATEVSLRQQELAKRIGSAYGRLQFELIQPLVNRLLDILDEFGLIDLQDFRVDGNTIAIKHESPLARAQAEEEVLSMVRLAELVVGFYGPETLHAVAPVEKFIPAITERLTIPMSSIATAAEIQEAKEAAATLAMQQMGGA